MRISRRWLASTSHVPADVRFGAGRISEVPQAVAGLGTGNVLVVTGRSTWRADRVRAALTEVGISSVVFGVATEPSIDVVRAAVRLAVESGCDAVLGYGGGSALDVAKAAAVLAATDTDPLEHLEVIGAGHPIVRPGLPCVAVPTTAGTGSEVTRNSVLSGGGVKASLRSPLLLPKVAIVDPDLLAGLPRPDHRGQRHGCALPAHRAFAVAARQPVQRRAGPGRHPPLGPLATPGMAGRNGRCGGTRRPGPREPFRRDVPGERWTGRGPWDRRRVGRSALGAPRRGLRGGAGPERWRSTCGRCATELPSILRYRA